MRSCYSYNSAGWSECSYMTFNLTLPLFLPQSCKHTQSFTVSWVHIVFIHLWNCTCFSFLLHYCPQLVCLVSFWSFGMKGILTLWIVLSGTVHHFRVELGTLLSVTFWSLTQNHLWHIILLTFIVKLHCLPHYILRAILVFLSLVASFSEDT